MQLKSHSDAIRQTSHLRRSR